MKEKYLNQKDWYCIKFSNKVHFDYDPQSKLHIIYKLREYYLDYIQGKKKLKEKDKKHYYYLATIDYNIKSNIYFYEVSGNTNEKMS